MNQQQLIDNIAKVSSRVRLAAQKSQRKECDIRMLAVSKTRPAEAIRVASQAGLSEFGENYLQEALDKMAHLADLDLVWHFIGPIQSNKTKAIAEQFQWVHSVDRLKIARRLSEQRPEGLEPLNICVQVNLSSENSKSGVAPQDAAALLRAASELPRIRIRGLMAIPAPTEDHAQQRQSFAELRELLETLQQEMPSLDTLSMGMSADLESAIAEGATIVRIGTDLFGARDK
ncbi:MAG: YggS family pyridoxal phosphate-dependent enzyme [Halioglobus sp.]